MSESVVGSEPKDWQGYPVKQYCEEHNFLVFYGVSCPTCRKESKG